MVVHTFNPRVVMQRQADLWVHDQSGLQSDYQYSQDYLDKPWAENNNNNKIKFAQERCVNT